MESTFASLICCWCNSVCCVLSMIFFFHKNIEIQEYFHSLDFSRSSRSFHNVFRLSFSRLISKQLKIVNFAVYQKLYFEACRDVPNFLLSIALLLHCDIYVLIWKHANVYFIQISFNNKPQLILYTLNESQIAQLNLFLLTSVVFVYRIFKLLSNNGIWYHISVSLGGSPN